MADPTIRVLSLGAGVQSTALLILAARGDLPGLDCAIFSDTGWEPRSVYEHLDRLEREIAQPAGIPIHRVSSGHIREDALDPEHRFASMPLYVKNQDGGDGMGRRQCTSEYKLKPIQRKVRELLGAQPRTDGVPGRVPKGRHAEQWIGISLDEEHRAIDAEGALREGTVRYERLRFPLLALGMTREHCAALNAAAGFGEVPKSACIGCPFHTNRQWRQMKTQQPEEWADAVEFDKRIRNGSARANALGQPLRGEMFLHRSRVPLDQADVERATSAEWLSRQGDLVLDAEVLAFTESLDNDEITGCSPFGCRSKSTHDEDLGGGAA